MSWPGVLYARRLAEIRRAGLVTMNYGTKDTVLGLVVVAVVEDDDDSGRPVPIPLLMDVSGFESVAPPEPEGPTSWRWKLRGFWMLPRAAKACVYGHGIVKLPRAEGDIVAKLRRYPG